MANNHCILSRDTDTIGVAEFVVGLRSILNFLPLVSFPLMVCHVSNGPVVFSEELNKFVLSYSLAFV